MVSERNSGRETVVIDSAAIATAMAQTRSLVSKVNFGRFCGRRLESSDRSENKIITIWEKQFLSVFVKVCLPLREGDVERDVDSRLV